MQLFQLHFWLKTEPEIKRFVFETLNDWNVNQRQFMFKCSCMFLGAVVVVGSIQWLERSWAIPILYVSVYNEHYTTPNDIYRINRNVENAFQKLYFRI